MLNFFHAPFVFLLSSRHTSGKGRLGGKWEQKNLPAVLGYRVRHSRCRFSGVFCSPTPMALSPGSHPPHAWEVETLEPCLPHSVALRSVSDQKPARRGKTSPEPLTLSLPCGQLPLGTSRKTLMFGGGKRREHCKGGLLIFLIKCN